MERSGTKIAKGKVTAIFVLASLLTSPLTHANMAGDIATQAVSAVACGELPACQANTAEITGNLKPNVDENTKKVKKLPDSVASTAQIIQQTQANNSPAVKAAAEQALAQTSKMASDAKEAASEAGRIIQSAATSIAKAMAGGALDAAYCMATYPTSLDATVPSNAGSRTGCVTQAGLMATALTAYAKKLNDQAQKNKEKAEGLERDANSLNQASNSVGSYGNGTSTGASPSLSDITPPPRSAAGLTGSDLERAEFGLKDLLGDQEAVISNNLDGSKAQRVNLGAATPFSDDVENDPRASKAPDLLSDEGRQKTASASAASTNSGSNSGVVEYTGGASEEEALRKKMESAPAFAGGSSFNGGMGVGGLPPLTTDEGSLNVNAPAEFSGFSVSGLDVETDDTHYALTIFDRGSLLYQYMDIRTRIPLAQGRGRALSLHQYLASKTAKPADLLEAAKAAAARLPASQ